MYIEPYFESDEKDNLFNQIPSKISNTYITRENLKDTFEKSKENKANKEKSNNEFYGSSIYSDDIYSNGSDTFL